MPNYYNEQVMRPLVIQYQGLDPATDEARDLLAIMVPEIGKIVKAIIFTHRFTIWDTVDELWSGGVEACISSMKTFNPNFITKKGKIVTTFNYFSLTAYRHCQWTTIRNKKHRMTQDIDYLENITVEQDLTVTRESVLEDMDRILRQHLIDKNKQYLLPMLDDFIHLLRIDGQYNARAFNRLIVKNIDKHRNKSGKSFNKAAVSGRTRRFLDLVQEAAPMFKKWGYDLE